MNKNEEGQIIILVAFVLIAVLLFLAVIIDGTRLLVEQQELNRVADAAGKAGLIIVGNHIVTQVIEAQLGSNTTPTGAEPDGNSSKQTPTPTPGANDILSWISDDHRKTLVAPLMQTLVATLVMGCAEENGLGLSNPSVTRLEIIYPYSFTQEDKVFRIRVQIEKAVPILFRKLLGLENGVLTGNAEEKIHHR